MSSEYFLTADDGLKESRNTLSIMQLILFPINPKPGDVLDYKVLGYHVESNLEYITLFRVVQEVWRHPNAPNEATIEKIDRHLVCQYKRTAGSKVAAIILHEASQQILLEKFA